MAKKITLKISCLENIKMDGKKFEMDEAVAMQMLTIKNAIDFNAFANILSKVIPVFNVSADILFRVIKYCKRHADAKPSAAAGGGTGAGDDSASSSSSWAVEEGLEQWDAVFVKVDQAILVDLMLAANYLGIEGVEGLVDLIAQTLADMFKGKTPKQIRKTFNIKNDINPEEEEEQERAEQELPAMFADKLRISTSD